MKKGFNSMRFGLRTVLLSLSVLIFTSAHAKKNTTDNTWFIGAGAGGSWLGLPNNASVYNGASVGSPYNRDLYTTHPDNVFTVGQLDAGYRWQEASQYVSYYQAYLQFRHYITSNIDGNVTQYSVSNFTNYTYRMDYAGDLFTLNGKIDLKPIHHIMPYVAMGVGFILNHLNNYNESPTSGVIPRTSPDFSGRTDMNFAVTLGVGFDYILSNNYWLTLGYDHVFQGDIKSGAGDSTWSNTDIIMGRLKMDTVFFNINARFPEALQTA